MWWQLLVIAALVSLISVFAKRITSWLVFSLLSKLLRCNSLKFGHIGVFSVADLKVRFSSFTLEVDKVWLSSSFFNQAFTKPLVICFGDIRLEGHKSSIGNNRRSSAMPPSPESEQQNEKAKGPVVEDKIRRFSPFLQYVAVTVSNLDIVLLDILLPDCLVHLAVEQIDLDTFRDRDSIQIDLCWKMLNFKMLHRSEDDRKADETVNKTKELLHIATESRITVFLKPTDYCLKGITVKIVSPVAAVSDAIINVFPQRKEEKSIKSIATDAESSDETRMESFLAKIEKFEVDFSSVAVSFFSSFSKQLQLSVKSVVLKGSSDNEAVTKGLKLDVSEICLYGHRGSVVNVSRVDAEVEMTNPDFCVRCYVENVSGNVDDDSVSYWRQFWMTKLESKSKVSSNESDKSSSLSQSNSIVGKRNVHVNIELNCVACSYVTASSKSHYFTLSFASFNRDGVSGAFEFCLDSFAISNVSSAATFPEAGIMEHQWGDILYMKVLIVQVEQDTRRKMLRVQLDQMQFEWNSAFLETIVSFIPPKRDDGSTRAIEGDREDVSFMVIAKISDVGVYMPIENGSCVYLLAQSVRIDKAETNFLFLAHGFYVGRQPVIAEKTLVCDIDNSSGLTLDRSRVAHARLTMEKEENVVISLHCNQGLELSWSPLLHYIVYSAVIKTKTLLTECGILKPRSKEPRGSTPAEEDPREIRIHFSKLSHLNITLPENHTIVLSAHSLKFRRRGNTEMVIETRSLDVTIDDNPIFLLEPIRIEKMQSHPTLVESRHLSAGLLTADNQVWMTTIGKAQAVFPYEYDFALVQDEFLNCFKWLKSLHKPNKTPFTIDSPLPSDIMILVQEFIFELSDDPFEVRLRDNYLLLMDEYLESERRLQMLETKLDDLRKVSPLLPRSKVQELHASLLKKNSDIYIQRSQKLYGTKPSRTHLFRWNLKNVAIKALADLSLHGEENATKNIRTMDPESPWPSSIEFNTLWCRVVEFDFEEWLMTMRDYPQPYVSMVDGHIWGKLAGAEAEGNERAKRTATLDLGAPFKPFAVLRNMPPLKFYYDLCSEIKTFKCAYGPCWEPSLAMINICFDKINKPSVDPSPTLPFWDKIRQLFHGRLTLACDRLVSVLLASADPYNTTEQMEWTFNEFQFDWTSGRFAVESDLDVYIRTASKYDDCRLLHLPNLRLQCKLHWSCLGDSSDHHSIYPCAPDKLPDYSVHKEHDSYRAFRSQHLNLGMSLNIKQEFFASDSQCPQLLLYANTFRWLDAMKNTISAVHRPIRRGPLFKNTRQKKLQLSRHYKHLQLSLSLPRFIISYWYSFSSDRGVRIIGQAIQFSSAYQLGFGVPRRRRSEDNLSRRTHASLRVTYMNAELMDAEMYLFSERPDLAGDSNKSFFIGVHRWTYCREMASEKPQNSSSYPTHKVVVHDFKGSWTSSNRDVVLFILDGIQKARVLQRNLSGAALKRWQVSEEPPEKLKTRKSTSTAMNELGGTSPSNRADAGGYATNLLEQLIAEADTKFMAYSETSEISSQQLHGIALCQTDDELFTKWQIELINSQVALKGFDTGGYVLCTAAKAMVTQKVRAPVWRENQLLGKVTWVAMLSGMQYFATVGTKETAGAASLNDVKWLTKELIEERSCSDQSLDVVESFRSTGEAPGSVVAGNAPTDLCPQLQRIISRCSCQLYFCHFPDSVEMDDDCGGLPPLPTDDIDPFWQRKEYVDCFTLKHNTLNISTNPLQYGMIFDILNNLLLYVDPKQKESAEKLTRYRFQLQLQSVDDLRPNIMLLQEEVRQLLSEQRYFERQIYFLSKHMAESQDTDLDSKTNQELVKLNQDMESIKVELQGKSDDLAMTISCFREKQVQRQRSALARVSDDQQAQIARRFEVCFEDAQWRLTAVDGQLGLSDLQIRNFLYTRVSRINDSGEHLLEIGFVKITNLLPNSPYRDVLQMQSRNGVPNDRQPAVRVICRDLAPVGGISVKEHFEVNVAPMVVQISYIFFRTMMDYFFPDRNIDTEDQQNLDNGFEHGSVESEKSKQRAEKNNVFLYIKIPEVPFMVSYKGEKEKNIEDVESFQLEFPLVEYHDRNWTWLDLALAIKQRCKRVLVQQFMKQKLLRSRIGAAFGGNQQQIDPTNLPEEEKARLLLGSKLMGTPDKSSKKSFIKGSKP